jgi:hypothetical protein
MSCDEDRGGRHGLCVSVPPSTSVVARVRKSAAEDVVMENNAVMNSISVAQ